MRSIPKALLRRDRTVVDSERVLHALGDLRPGRVER
jgi:hypothetical protein